MVRSEQIHVCARLAANAGLVCRFPMSSKTKAKTTTITV